MDQWEILSNDLVSLALPRYGLPRLNSPYAFLSLSLCPLGIFGIDRIYLGYYVSGLLKLFTCGFMLVGALVDFLYVVHPRVCIRVHVTSICLD